MLNFFKRREFTNGMKVHSQMNHPNIVKLVDFVSFDTIPYRVMEYIQGSTVADEIDRILASPKGTVPGQFQTLIERTYARIERMIDRLEEGGVEEEDIEDGEVEEEEVRE